MRRRFGRRRRGDEGPKGLDVARELERVVETGTAPVGALSPVSEDEVPATLAAVGTGTDQDGNLAVVSVSPESGAAAWLGGLSVALGLAQQEGFRGRVFAISPRWRAPARALLGATGSLPFEIRALVSAAEGSEGAAVEAEPAIPVALSLDLVGQVPGAVRSAVQKRAAEALRGLAAKHGGILQREVGGLRLILMGQPVAVLKRAGAGAELELLRPRRERIALGSDALSEAFDQLEGSLRKTLADRKNRDGEPGMRARESGTFSTLLGVAAPILWPLGWADQCPIDLLGVGEDGSAIAGALRRDLDLPALLPIVEAAAYLEPIAAWLLPGSRAANGSLAVRLALAAERCETPTARVLYALSPPGAVYELSTRGRGAARFDLREAPAPVPFERASVPAPAPPSALVAQRPATEEPRARDASAEAASEPEVAQEPREESADARPGDSPKPARRFEEMSLFDLSDDDENATESGARRRRRRGGRGRSRSSSQSLEARSESASEPTDTSPEDREEPIRPRRPRRRRRRRRSRPLMVEDAAEEESEDEEEEQTGEVVAIDDDDAEGGDEGDSESIDNEDEEEAEEDVEALEEEAATAVLDPVAEERASLRSVRPVRRRAAIVAHADPVSIGAAVLLARDLRLIDGIWVYNQSELMTFFRGVATDLGENSSIFLIGFTASPVRETLQTASLYRGRLTWFDHHEWPPEDAEALRQAIGAEAVKLAPGAGSSLPLVAEECTRRSRFSDKLLDLLTGRFSPHDYERWGRLWWWRLAELEGQSGERRRDLDALLTGRPSELAREAATQEAPPLPPEAEFVASRDLPLVHFGGYTLLRLAVPAELDLLLTARIARERYGAHLAVAHHEGDRAVVLVGDDAGGRRGFNLNAMAEHLAAKFSWVDPLPTADHVTRFRVVDLLERPERVEEVVAEVAMGRSVLEG